MRVLEKCSCGASIEVVWREPDSTYDKDAIRESKRSRAELAAFREAHKVCRDGERGSA